MAVQAQHPSTAFTRIQNSLLEELQAGEQFQYGPIPVAFNNDTAAFSNPQSELTCIANSGSNKRIRDESDPVMNAFACQSRVVDSAGTSTSGRSVGQDLAAQLYQHNAEIDALVLLQNERLRSGVEQLQKRHCRSLISAMEDRVARKLKEKDIELQCAARKNLELQEKIRQMSAESQIWFNVAKNNEAIVSSLRSSLEQVLLQGSAVNAGAVRVKEGYGDSDGTPFPAGDAESCCYEGEAGRAGGAVGDRRRRCRVCCEEEVGVLLLPCRHLCLCRDCEPGADACPVCHVTKNACLQIFMS